MLESVYKTVKKYNLIASGEAVVTGLSGGADSVALLLSLIELKEKLGIRKIIACHINHNLRPTAKRDEEFSRNLCKRLGVDFYAKSVDIGEIKKRLKVCEEEAGRIARYEFFHEIRIKEGAEKIATAHNLNDQAETFFMRLLRGSSGEGLSAIKPIREDGVIRPLLEVKREKIEEYLDKRNQGFVTDETNLETNYLRNKIRLLLIPFLKENFNFSENTIAETVRLLKMDSEYISSIADGIIKSGVSQEGRISFSLSYLNGIPDAVLSRVIKRGAKLKFELELLRNQIDSAVALVRDGGTGKSIRLSADVVCAVDYNEFVIKKIIIPERYEYTLSEGDNIISEINAIINLSLGKSDGADSITVSSLEKLAVRCRKEGDRVHIKSVGHKKLKDIFIDKKISREKRGTYPVITQNGEIIWIPGLYKREEKEGGYSLTIRRMDNEK